MELFENSIKKNKTNKDLATHIEHLSEELGKKRIDNIGEVFMNFYSILEKENLLNQENFISLVNGCVNATIRQEEQLLYKLMYEKEQLENSIILKKEEINHNIKQSFIIIEEALMKSKNPNSTMLKFMKESKLQNAKVMDILKEITESVFLTTLEKSDDVEDAAEEISKNIVYEAINEGDFLKQRFLDISKSVIEVAIELADRGNKFYAKELLRGTIKGTKEGIQKSVEKFKNDLKFLPQEVKELRGINLEQVQEELVGIESFYMMCVKESVKKSNGISAEIIDEILLEIPDNYFARTKMIAIEIGENLSQRYADFKNKSLLLFEQDIKEKALKRLETLKENMKEFEEKANENLNNTALKEKFTKSMNALKEEIKSLEEKANETLKNIKENQKSKDLGNELWQKAKDLMTNKQNKKD